MSQVPANARKTAGRTGVGLALVTAMTAATAAPAMAAPAPAAPATAAPAVAPRPVAARVLPAAPAAATYTVREGDTVWGIARQTGTTAAAIMAANGLGPQAVIYPGQTLKLSGTSSPAAGASSSSGRVGSTFLGRTYSDSVVGAANSNAAALDARSVPSKAQMQAMVRRTAQQMGVDPALALAHAHLESGFNMRAVSPANAVGVMQVIPSSGEWASDLVGRRLDLLDPQDNVTAGVAIIHQLHRMTSNGDSAIAGYYQGMGSVNRNGMYRDTRNYVANVRSLMNQYR